MSASKELPRIRFLWIDQDRGWLTCWRFLVTEATAQRLSNEVAVVLSLCIPSVFIIIRRLTLFLVPLIHQGEHHFIQWLSRCQKKLRQSSRSIATVIPLNATARTDHGTTFEETLGSTGDEDNPIRAMQTLVIGLRNARETEDSITEEICRILKQDIPSVLKRLWEAPSLGASVVLVSILILGLSYGIIYAGIASSDILSDSNGPSDSTNPGLWLQDHSDSWMAARGVTDILFDKEFRAGEYEDKCYSSSGNDAMCNQFHTRRLPYHTKANSTCPFDGDGCIQGSHSALTISTGTINSEVLGINTRIANRFTFERNMTCAPIFNDDRYQRYQESSMGNAWQLFYSTDTLQEYAPKTPGNPNMIAPGRSASSGSSASTRPPATYRAWAGMFDPYYHPENVFRLPMLRDILPEFTAGNQTVCLLFVSSLESIVHQAPRSDPIFPTNSETYYPHDEDSQYDHSPSGPPYVTYWVYDSTRAGVLGCVDSFRICDSVGSQCWDRSNFSTDPARDLNCHVKPPGCPEASSPKFTRERSLSFYLLSVALSHSNAYDAIHYRGGAALDANQRFGGSWTLRLPEEQWKVEAEKLFRTSLARMQIDLYDLATGTYAGVSGATNAVPDEFQDAYELLILPISGYQNVDGLWFVSINVVCLLVFLSSRRYSTPERRRDKIAQGQKGGYHDNLWGTIALKKLWDLAYWLWLAAPQAFEAFKNLCLGLAKYMYTGCDKAALYVGSTLRGLSR